MSVALSPSSFFPSQRVSVRYVCFGFSLARSCRTRTIDLQCQSLSLRRAFLLCSVCLSLHLTVASYALRWPTLSQNQTKITAKIDRKSIPGDTSGVPESGENRSRDPVRTPRGVQERPEGVSGVSRERPGASPARRRSVRRVAKATPGRQKGRPGAPGSAPRSPKSTPSRVRDRKNRVFFALRDRDASSERFFVNFCRFLVFSQSAKCLFRTTPASKNRGSALRAASLVARLLQPRKTSKINPKIDQKSSKIASRSVSGALFARLWSLGAARSSDLGRIKASRAAR